MQIAEAVEKVLKQIFGRDAEKSNPLECATINNLMLGKGQETPENHPLIVMFDFFYWLIRSYGPRIRSNNWERKVVRLRFRFA